MKKIILISVLGILIISCGSAPKLYSPQISSLPQTEEGTINIHVSGMGSDKKVSYENAIYNAFTTLLFQGVPASIQSRPMIPADDADRVRPIVEKCWTDNNCYKNFIVQINPGTYEKVTQGYSATTDIKINIVALRTYLEQQNVIRKFGL